MLYKNGESFRKQGLVVNCEDKMLNWFWEGMEILV